MNIEYNEKNWPEVFDYHSPLLKVDVFRSEDFKTAVNINRGLYTGLDNKEEMRRRIALVFLIGNKTKEEIEEITNMKYEEFKKLNYFEQFELLANEVEKQKKLTR